MQTNDFKKLNPDQLQKLSREETIEYYKNWRDYCAKLPYDEKLIKKQERKYIVAATIGIPLVKAILNPRCINKELMPKSNGLIFASNHLGYFDQLPIISAIGIRPVHFMIASTLFEKPLVLGKPLGPFYVSTGAVPVDRESEQSKSEAIDTMIQIVLNGGNIYMAPEGTRRKSTDFLKKFKFGVVNVARVTGAPIIPLGINDDYKRGNLIVRIGEPMTIDQDVNLVDANKKLYDNIATLICENKLLELERAKTLTIKKGN